MDRLAASHEGSATGIVRSASPVAAVSAPSTSGSWSSSARSPREPTRTIGWPSTEAASASRAVSACSRCQGSRSSAVRCTAAIASYGSSGDTGASEPSTTSTPSSSIQRNAKQRSARPPDPLGHVAIVEQVRRLDAPAHAELGHPAYVVAGDELGVLDRAAGTGLRERRQRLLDGGVADRVRRHRAHTPLPGASSTRRSSPERLGCPDGYSSRWRRRRAGSTTPSGCSASRRR